MCLTWADTEETEIPTCLTWLAQWCEGHKNCISYISWLLNFLTEWCWLVTGHPSPPQLLHKRRTLRILTTFFPSLILSRNPVRITVVFLWRLKNIIYITITDDVFVPRRVVPLVTTVVLDSVTIPWVQNFMHVNRDTDVSVTQLCVLFQLNWFAFCTFVHMSGPIGATLSSSHQMFHEQKSLNIHIFIYFQRELFFLKILNKGFGTAFYVTWVKSHLAPK